MYYCFRCVVRRRLLLGVLRRRCINQPFANWEVQILIIVWVDLRILADSDELKRFQNFGFPLLMIISLEREQKMKKESAVTNEKCIMWYSFGNE